MGAMPRLLVCKNCINTIRALENYSFKKGRRPGSSVTENVSEKYKDAADVVRYAVMWKSANSFSSVSDRTTTNSDYKKFCMGRIPKMYRTQALTNIKGRRVA
jgi:hypothetical protein